MLEAWETQSASTEVKSNAKQECEVVTAADSKRKVSQGGSKLTWDVERSRSGKVMWVNL